MSLEFSLVQQSIIQYLFFYSDGTLSDVHRSLHGLNPIEFKYEIENLTEHGFINGKSHIYSLTNKALEWCRDSGLVSLSEFEQAISIAEEYFISEVIPRLPPAHPRNFEWRFSITGLKRMASIIYTDCPFVMLDSLAALSAPLVAIFFWKLGLTKQIALFDQNPRLVALAHRLSSNEITGYECDLSQPIEHNDKFSFIVMDPPWYPDYYQIYLSTASSLIHVPGRIYGMIQPRYTHKGTLSERIRIIQHACEHGFAIINYLPAGIGYQTSLFEKTEYRNYGISIDYEWGTGDLIVLASTVDTKPHAPAGVSLPYKWKEYYFPNITVSIRLPEAHDENYEADSWLINAQGLISSFGRLDINPPSVDIWTSEGLGYIAKPRWLFHLLFDGLSRGSTHEEIRELLLQRGDFDMDRFQAIWRKVRQDILKIESI